MASNTFQPGARVKCIDADVTHHRLVLGAVYTITEAHDDNQGVVLAEERQGSTWCNDRFIAVEG